MFTQIYIIPKSVESECVNGNLRKFAAHTYIAVVEHVTKVLVTGHERLGANIAMEPSVGGIVFDHKMIIESSGSGEVFATHFADCKSMIRESVVGSFHPSG